MEDAATAEIARIQLWQWVYHGAKLVRFHLLPSHDLTSSYTSRTLAQPLQRKASTRILLILSKKPATSRGFLPPMLA